MTMLVFLHVLLVFIYSVGFGLNCTGGVLDFRGALNLQINRGPRLDSKEDSVLLRINH